MIKLLIIIIFKYEDEAILSISFILNDPNIQERERNIIHIKFDKSGYIID